MKICIQCYVSGLVQGVWYRASTQEQALQLGVSGYARNLRDGRVEILACGEEEAVFALRDWLWKGPPHARVNDVKWQIVSCQDVMGFTAG